MGFLIRIIFHLSVNRWSHRYFDLWSALKAFAERILSSATLAVKWGVGLTSFSKDPVILISNCRYFRNKQLLVLGLGQTPTGVRTEFILKKYYKWFQYQKHYSKAIGLQKILWKLHQSVHLESFQHQNTRKKAKCFTQSMFIISPKRIGGDI